MAEKIKSSTRDKKKSNVKSASKPAVKTVSRVPVVRRKLKPVTAATPDRTGVSVAVMGTDGKSEGKISLPGALFAAKVNKPLLAQAVRVYLANQRQGGASTKTRGEVEGSTRKIYRQKGTGKARHGSIRAPIFVGGGIVFGPKHRDYSLGISKKMKRAALTSALTSAYKNGNVVIAGGLMKLAPKTKIMAATLTKYGPTDRMLLVIPSDAEMVARGTRNIAGVDIVSAHSLNTYDVLTHRKLVILKEAVRTLHDVFAEV